MEQHYCSTGGGALDKLTENIISLSSSKIWDVAKLEWKLDEVYEAEEHEACLCGHFPIKDICMLKNKLNNNSAVVGNCCVKRFIGLPSDKIFQAIKRVRKDNKKSLNIEAVDHAYKKGWINDWENDFYIDIMRKRNLTERQLQKKITTNRKSEIGVTNEFNRGIKRSF